MTSKKIKCYDFKDSIIKFKLEQPRQSTSSLYTMHTLYGCWACVPWAYGAQFWRGISFTNPLKSNVKPKIVNPVSQKTTVSIKNNSDKP